MIFTYGLFSKIADRSPVTAPMVFVAMGILVGPEPQLSRKLTFKNPRLTSAFGTMQTLRDLRRASEHDPNPTPNQ